ncbi:pilus assembly protein [Acinetobacter sp. ANC 4193]
MSKLHQKMLTFAVSAFVSCMVCQSISVQASDIDIYANATGGKTSILLMLDTSGSMGISSLVLPKTNLYGSPGDVDNSLCDRVSVSEYQSNRSSASNFYEWAYNLKDTNTGSPTYNKTSIYKSVTIGTTTIPYYVRGCTSGGLTQYDRLSRLKDAILPLLADTSSSGLSNSTIMGLGHFSSKTELTIGTASNRLTDGHSGRILVPNAPLTNAQRISIAQQIAAIKSLDTTTNEDGTSNSNLKLSSNSYPNVTKSSSGTPTAQAYAEAGAYMMGTGTGTGGTNSGQVSTIYDGYMVMQNGSEQVYFVCMGLGSGTTGALGATVKQCNNNWPSYDSANKTIGTGTISGGVYKPDGSGGWTQITSQSNFKTQSGTTMANGWETFTKLPVGWRYGGWMKVANEPMDIEPIVGTVWTGYAGKNGNDTIGLVSYRTNPFLVGGTTDSLIGGFAFSADASKNGNVYRAGGSTSSCDGNGIYFLTDGAPNSTKDTMAQTIMNLTLNNNSNYTFTAKPSSTNVLVSPTLQSGLFTGETGGWEYIGEYAKKLLDKTKNPANMSIKTAVVGFGSSFSGIPKNTDGTYNCASVQTTNQDAYNACKWGGSDFGKGGFYYAENSDDIKNSITNFVKNVTPTFKSVATGSPTLPQDVLNPLRVQPYGYYASFVPTPQDSTQLWLGNLNKYNLLNGQLYSTDQTTKLFNTDGSLNSNASGIWTDGVKGQLPLGIVTGSKVNRTIYTNRKITNSVASEDKTLNQITFISDYLNSDPQRNYWLNLLGYNVAVTDTSALSTYINKTPDLRQLGATMHSTPILLTQSGTITSTLDTTARQDYLLFGTTQGVLHVVDKNGKEVFAFVPNEMMNNTNQRNAFLSTTSSTGGSSNLFYGIDAPWAAYTQYVANSDGSLTVGASDRSTTDNSIQGKQWVYGGLRMGGRSYYSLNLTNISSPSLKFHISPDDSSITNSTETTSNVSALSFMGQSWSKPTIARVKFAGQSKLVMIVGGGYDAGYESPNYDQTNKKGAGIYMFDADNGQLLWWASANASSATDVQGAQAVTANPNLKYSVVSQINAIDRDGDGYVDNLYFGDLGGQAFRIDLNNTTSTATQKIDARVVRITNQHVTDGASPRFYEMPSFSAQSDSSLGLFGVVAFSSGNRSTPLSGVVGANNVTATTSADDGVFVIYDKDISKSDLYKSSYSLLTQDVTLQSLNTNYSTGVAVTNGGWVYRYGNTTGNAGVWKGMNSLYAVDSILYINVYYRDGVGIGGSCGAGIKGDSYLYRFCLPTGKCDRFASSLNTNGSPDRVKLGVGILGTGLGASNATGNEVKSTITTSTDCTQTANKNNIECQSFSNPGTIRTLRWYETSSK